MKIPRHFLLAAALLAGPALALAAADAPAAAQPAPTDLATLKIIPVADVIKAAIAATPGPVAKITLEAKAGAAVYAVEIPGANNAVTTVQVDAVSGKVIGSSTEFGPKKSATMGAMGAKPGEAGAKGKSRGKEDDDD